MSNTQEPSLFDPAPEPIRPYWQDGKPSSGYAAGASTSKDAEPWRLEKQKQVWLFLRDAGGHGVTWFEAVDLLNLHRGPNQKPMHHGTGSNALSNLHKAGHAARLTEQRGGSKVYVLPSMIDGRDTEPFVVKPTRKELAEAAFNAGKAKGLAIAHATGPQPTFDEWWETQ